MTLIFASMPSTVSKCGHGLLIAQHGDQCLHVVATDRGRLILARCDDEPLERRAS